MPSMSEWRVPYLLSNLDLVNESLTLMAGKASSPAAANWYSRSTPVVVSSVTPLTDSAIVVHLVLSVSKRARSSARNTLYSSESSSSPGGTTPAFSNCAPRRTSIVASPPSSRIMLAGSPGQVSICSAAHQYSSRDSPFQANTGVPLGSSTLPYRPTTTAAAAWSWVEKMLQDAQRTSAPRSTRVSISTAVCTVMCSDPEIRAPASGRTSAYSRRSAIRPGISCSASVISLRPKSARASEATFQSRSPDRSTDRSRPRVVEVDTSVLLRGARDSSRAVTARWPDSGSALHRTPAPGVHVTGEDSGSGRCVRMITQFIRPRRPAMIDEPGGGQWSGDCLDPGQPQGPWRRSAARQDRRSRAGSADHLGPRPDRTTTRGAVAARRDGLHVRRVRLGGRRNVEKKS